MNSKITYMIDMFKNEKTGNECQGITVMVDGDFQKGLDALMKKCGDKYPNYVDILNDAIFKGLKVIQENAEQNG